MKTTRFILMLLTVILTTELKAQSFSFGDLFGQQSKKEKLMAAQVGGIYTYLDALKGGYSIMHNGLDLTHELKRGTFGLHTGYFNSLEQVNPAVRQNPKAKAISDLYAQLNHDLNAEISWQKKQQLLKPNELAYLEKVSSNLLKLADQDLAALKDLLTSGKLRLTDEQRLDRLDKLYATLKDKAAFADSFTAKSRALAQNRQRAKAEKEQIQKLYGIH